MRTSSILTQRNFWIVTPLNLQEVASRLAAAFGLTDPDFGAEDNEEWVEGFARDGVTFYVCRQGGLTAPLRLIIKPVLPDPTEFGRRLAACLGETVSFGDVTYLGDEKFSYSEICRYEHEAA